MDTGDNYCNTCTCHDGVLLCTLMFCDGNKPCTLTGGETVPPTWTGNDTGDNYCNECQCKDGDLMCTKLACQPRCPIPGCIPPPEGCVYVEYSELDENNCPRYPCGILQCEEDHQAEISRFVMSIDREVVTVYYEGAKEDDILGVVYGLQYSAVEDIPLNSRDIVAKSTLSSSQGSETYNLAIRGGPFFATMWNNQGEEVAARVLFDRFTPEFLSNNCKPISLTATTELSIEERIQSLNTF